MSSTRSNPLADAIVAYLYKLTPAYLLWLKDQSDESKKPSFEGRHFYGITKNADDDSAVTQVAKQDNTLMSKITDLIKEQEDSELTIEKDVEVFSVVREMDKQIDDLHRVIKYLNDKLAVASVWNNFWNEMPNLTEVERKKIQYEVLSGLVLVMVNEEISKLETAQIAKIIATAKPSEVKAARSNDEILKKLHEKKENVKKAFNFLRTRHGGITIEQLSRVLIDATPQEEISGKEKKQKEKKEKKEIKESLAAKKAVEKDNVLIHHILQMLRLKKSARDGLSKEEKKLFDFNVKLSELNQLDEEAIKNLFSSVDKEVQRLIKEDASNLQTTISELSGSKFLPLTDEYFDETSREASRRGSTDDFIEVPPELLQEVSRIVIALFIAVRSVCSRMEAEIKQSKQEDEIFFSKKQILIQTYVNAVVKYLNNKMPEKQSDKLKDVLSFFNLLATNVTKLAFTKERVGPMVGMLQLPIWEEHINWQTAIVLSCIRGLKKATDDGVIATPRISFTRLFDSPRESLSARGSNRSQSSGLPIVIEDEQEVTSTTTAPKPSGTTTTVPKVEEGSQIKPVKKLSEDKSDDEVFQKRKGELLKSHQQRSPQRSPLPVRKQKSRTHSPSGSTGLWKDSNSSEYRDSTVASEQTVDVEKGKPPIKGNVGTQ